MGPLKHGVAKYIQRGQDLLSRTDSVEPENVKSHQGKLQLARDLLSNAANRLQEKHDAWVAMVQDLPDEQDHYDDACEELMNLQMESDETQIRLETDIVRLSEADTSTDTTAVSQQTTTVHQGTTSGAAQPPLVNSSSVPASQTPTTVPSRPTAFKAAKINLPKFSGDYLRFKQFWGIFDANIHQRTDLTNIEKFTYLLDLLQGEAETALDGVLVDDDNYEAAVTLLKSRFDRADDRLVPRLYGELTRIPLSGKKTIEKQHTLDACERILRQLESAKEEVNSNKSLTVTLLGKFPPGMVKDLKRTYHVGPNSKLDDVREGLREYIAEEETTSGLI